jgi:hypothetical protein
MLFFITFEIVQMNHNSRNKKKRCGITGNMGECLLQDPLVQWIEQKSKRFGQPAAKIGIDKGSLTYLIIKWQLTGEGAFCLLLSNCLFHSALGAGAGHR